jgi:hypothetical protein
VALFGFGPLKQTFSAEDAAKPLNLKL